MNSTLILGSGSARRKEILSFFNLPFEQVSPDFDERSIPFDGDPVRYVEVLSEGKLHSLTPAHPSRTILTADTIVYCEETVYGKPTNHQHAIETLQALSGRWHSVFTALSIIHNGATYTATEETRVLFHPIADGQIHRYLDSLHCDDKAGAYLIQGPGSVIVARIEGCYHNVVGLPINTLQKLLLQAGTDLWHCLA